MRTNKETTETEKPASPINTIRRRPVRSDRRAHTGAAMTQTNADTEKAAAITLSDMPSERPIAGITDCNAVFPAPIVSMTTKSNDSSGAILGRTSGMST